MKSQIEAFKPELADEKMLNKTTYLQNKIINWLNKQYLPINIWIKIIEGILFELDKLYVINELNTSGDKNKAFQEIKKSQIKYLDKLEEEINFFEIEDSL
jgi:hypothetical protein